MPTLSLTDSGAVTTLNEWEHWNAETRSGARGGQHPLAFTSLKRLDKTSLSSSVFKPCSSEVH